MSREGLEYSLFGIAQLMVEEILYKLAGINKEHLSNSNATYLKLVFSSR